MLVSAEGAGATNRQPAPTHGGESQAMNVQLDKVQPLAPLRLAGSSSVQRAVKRLTKRVNELTSAYNTLVTQHNELVTAVSTLANCIGKQPVTRYAGYWWGTPEIQTSAMDFTEPGDPISAVMMAWKC
jgi:hypothetical protein